MIYLCGILLSVLTVWYTPAVITVWNFFKLVCCMYIHVLKGLWYISTSVSEHASRTVLTVHFIFYDCNHCLMVIWLSLERRGGGLVALLLLKIVFHSCHVIHKTRILGEKTWHHTFDMRQWVMRLFLSRSPSQNVYCIKGFQICSVGFTKDLKKRFTWNIKCFLFYVNISLPMQFCLQHWPFKYPPPQKKKIIKNIILWLSISAAFLHLTVLLALTCTLNSCRKSRANQRTT